MMFFFDCVDSAMGTGDAVGSGSGSDIIVSRGDGILGGGMKKSMVVSMMSLAMALA